MTRRDVLDVGLKREEGAMPKNDSTGRAVPEQEPSGVPVPVPVVPPPAVKASCTTPKAPPLSTPVVKSEGRPTADGGCDVIERTETRHTFPPPVRACPPMHYGGQEPRALPRPPTMYPSVTQSTEPVEYASAAKFFDDCARSNGCVEWEVEVRRNGPTKWPEKGKNAVPLRIGELARWPIDNFASLRRRVVDTFGGGKYKLSIRDENNNVRRTIEISASPLSSPPRNPETDEPEEEETTNRTTEGINKPVELSEIEKVKMQKELAKQRADLEIVEAEIELKKQEMARRREAREQASPQIDVLREEMRASKEQTAQVLKLMQEQAEREEKARAEATVAALIQVNANLIQLCARIADNARLNEAQMLLSLLPLLNKEEKAGDPKVASQLQRLVDALRKDSEKRTDVKHPA